MGHLRVPVCRSSAPVTGSGERFSNSVHVNPNPLAIDASSGPATNSLQVVDSVPISHSNQLEELEPIIHKGIYILHSFVHPHTYIICVVGFSYS